MRNFLSVLVVLGFSVFAHAKLPSEMACNFAGGKPGADSGCVCKGEVTSFNIISKTEVDLYLADGTEKVVAVSGNCDDLADNDFMWFTSPLRRDNGFEVCPGDQVLFLDRHGNLGNKCLVQSIK